MAKVLKQQGKVLIYGNKAIQVPEPTKSWFYVTEYDSNGYPIKAKTIGCSGEMQYDYMYSSYNKNYLNVISRFLQEFEINEGVKNIKDYAFSYCSSLKSITIPDSMSTIQFAAFYYCSSLISVEMPNVTSIGEYAFCSCSSLTSISFSSTPYTIYPNAFMSCSSCLLFDFRKATVVPQLMSANAFDSTPADKKIVVPDALYDSWITATNWSDSSIVSSIIKASDYEASL